MYYVVQDGTDIEYGPFDIFEEAVCKGRSIGLDCSVWDDAVRTNWGRLLVAVLSPENGLCDLRLEEKAL